MRKTKIAFLCGSLEPGRDGVGDYSRTLGVELLRQGHDVVAVALNDKHANCELEEKQQLENTSLLVFRIPQKYGYKKSFILAKVWLDRFDPEWISLQFVPYSFHDKGLPFGIDKHFYQLIQRKKLHIMFHELWIGFTVISPVKHRIIGFFQRKIAESIVQKLHPDVITTTNLLYQLLLEKSQIKASVLSLFSNIPVAPVDALFRSEVLERLGIEDSNFDQWRLIGIFGNLYPQANLEEAIAQQLQSAKLDNKNLGFIGIGRISISGVAELKRLESIFRRDVKFLHLGEQSSERVSNMLQMLQVGISCTPAQHIGKSGVFASMKLHGLEIILPNEEIIPEYDLEIKQFRKDLEKKPVHSWSATFVSQQFLNLMLHP